jgi:hypothetical protein
MGDLNISLWGGLTWLCYALIVGFLLRSISSIWPDNPVSKALLFIN